MTADRSPYRVALFAALLVTVPATAKPIDPAPYEALRSADLRLATIAYRLATANVALCRDVAPTPGLALQSADQYPPAERGALRSVFGFETPVSVEAVVPGSAAALAGVRANDSIVAVDGTPVPAGPPAADRPTSATRDAAAALIAAEPAAMPLHLSLVHDGQTRTVTLQPSPGCRSRFEVVTGPDMTAVADGNAVQVGSRFFERYPDDQVAVVVAHELAHNILRHRARLDAAHVDRGLFAEVGRSARLFQRTESDADLLGMYLMRNAGYDPEIAVRFWREHGGDVDGGLFRSRTHPSSGKRAAAIQAGIDAIPPDAPMPYIPPVLATRDQPM